MNSHLINALTKIVAAKIYFHGTRSDIKKFTTPGSGKHGIGFYFTPDINEARHFAKTLAGIGRVGEPKVYKVALTFRKPFNTMSVEDCQKVAKHFGLVYKEPKFAGGLKEHYHSLETQLVGVGGSKSTNQKIEEAGYDSVLYDLMEHVILFHPNQIKIREVIPV